MPETAEPETKARLCVETLSPLPPRAFKAARSAYSVTGALIAEIRLAPPLYADNIVRALRQAPVLPQQTRLEALAKAAELFADGCLCGLSGAEYQALIAELTGLPPSLIATYADYIAQALPAGQDMESLGQMQPSSLRPTESEARRGCAQWLRKGEVLAVIAPGNAPAVHALWPQALALGYKVAVYPSEREPITAQRLVEALRQAGMQDYAALLPADHEGADGLTKAADLSLIYGGDEIVRRYGGRADILVQGPGRSKIILGRDFPAEKTLPLLWGSVAGLAGTACVCASAVLAEEDAQGAAERFYAFAREKFADKAGRREWALQLSPQRFQAVMQMAESCREALVGGMPAYEQNADGTYAVMPLIRFAAAARSPLVQNELPFAAVTFAPFDREKDLPAVGKSLALTVASYDEALIAACEALPHIGNFYIGNVPTVFMRPDIPHDGYLTEFLMTARGYKRG